MTQTDEIMSSNTTNSNTIVHPSRDVDMYLSAVKPTIISAIIVTNIILNTLVMAVIAKYPQLREDRTTLFMFSLALSDLLAACTFMPISAALCSKATPGVHRIHDYLPNIQQMCLKWCGFNSVNSLSWLTLCKMVAITKPFRYEQLLSRNRCYTILCLDWIIGALIATIGSQSKSEWNMPMCFSTLPVDSSLSALFKGTTIMMVTVPLVAIVYATTKIISVIVQTHLQMSALANSIGGYNNVNGLGVSLTRQSIRSCKNVLVICVAVLVLSVPLVCYSVAVSLWGYECLPVSFGFTVFWIAMCNSFVNSLIYLVLYRSVRRKTYEMLMGIIESWRLR